MPDSAKTEFFINTKDNPFLDYSLEGRIDGYAVLGEVRANFPVVKLIEAEAMQTINYLSANYEVLFQRKDVPVSNV